MNQVDSDEAYARSLQAQELGFANVNLRSAFSINSYSSLIQHSDNENDSSSGNENIRNTENGVVGNNTNQTLNIANEPAANNIINLNTLDRNIDPTTTRIALFISLFVSLPQIISALVILALYWNDNTVCDVDHNTEWKFWASITAGRLATYCAMCTYIHFYKTYLDSRPALANQLQSMRSGVEAFGLLWFLIGNVWILGHENYTNCTDPSRSPIYRLCVAMLVIQYIQICLPCIMAFLLLPIFCCCMPCFIRWVARYHSSRPHGASVDTIERIPLISLGDDASATINSSDLSCPICINDMVTGDEIRLLPCKHTFHRQVSCRI